LNASCSAVRCQSSTDSSFSLLTRLARSLTYRSSASSKSTLSSAPDSTSGESGALLSVDLDEALDRYVRERASLVKRLKELSVEDWQRTAEHEAFSHYSVWIMFRHVLNHEMFHAYRIEELLLKKDWE